MVTLLWVVQRIAIVMRIVVMWTMVNLNGVTYDINEANDSDENMCNNDDNGNAYSHQSQISYILFIGLTLFYPLLFQF